MRLVQRCGCRRTAPIVKLIVPVKDMPNPSILSFQLNVIWEWKELLAVAIDLWTYLIAITGCLRLGIRPRPATAMWET